VLEAIKRNEWALEFASSELKNNKEIVLAAITQNPYTIKYASPEIQAGVKEHGLSFLETTDKPKAIDDIINNAKNAINAEKSGKNNHSNLGNDDVGDGRG